MELQKDGAEVEDSELQPSESDQPAGVGVELDLAEIDDIEPNDVPLDADEVVEEDEEEEVLVPEFSWFRDFASFSSIGFLLVGVTWIASTTRGEGRLLIAAVSVVFFAVVGAVWQRRAWRRGLANATPLPEEAIVRTKWRSVPITWRVIFVFGVIVDGGAAISEVVRGVSLTQQINAIGVLSSILGGCVCAVGIILAWRYAGAKREEHRRSQPLLVRYGSSGPLSDRESRHLLLSFDESDPNMEPELSGVAARG